MNECEGYLTPEGACLQPVHPIGVTPIVEVPSVPVTELPNTGDGNIMFLFLGLALVVAGVLLKWRQKVSAWQHPEVSAHGGV